MVDTAEHKVVRVITKMEPSLVERVERVADEFYGGNRSLLIRLATIAVIDRRERELAERDANELQAA